MDNAIVRRSPKARLGSGQTKEKMLGYLMIAPAVLIIAIFGLFPIFYSIYMSTFNWRVKKGEFIGLGNFQQLFGEGQGLIIFVVGLILLGVAYWLWNSAFKSNKTFQKIAKIAAALVLIGFGVAFSTGWNLMTQNGDGEFFKSLTITLYYALLTVPTQLLIGLVLAVLGRLGQMGRGDDVAFDARPAQLVAEPEALTGSLVGEDDTLGAGLGGALLEPVDHRAAAFGAVGKATPGRFARPVGDDDFEIIA